MWSWKIYAANLTFSSVVGFPIYSESETLCLAFSLSSSAARPWIEQTHCCVWDIQNWPDLLWSSSSPLLSFRPLPCHLQSMMEGNHQLLIDLLVSPKVFPMNRTLCCHRGQTQSRVQHVWTSGPAVPVQWRTSGPEHSSQALLGSTAVKTQAI